MFHVGENSNKRVKDQDTEETGACSSHVKFSHRSLNVAICNNLSDTM